MTDNSGKTNCYVPQICLATGNVNCLLFSPLQMVSLGISGGLTSSIDGTGINCIGSNLQIGQQSQSDNGTSPRYSLSGLVKQIKDSIPELAAICFPQIDGLMAATEQETRMFDNIRMSVATCGSPSRYYNRCYLTGRDYTESESNALTGRLFSGARAMYGDRFYLVSFQYSRNLEHIFPVVDAYFNIVNKLVPLAVAFPALAKMSGEQEYLKCRVRRTSGAVQTGFIQLGPDSMIIYKSHRDELGNRLGLVPYLTVYFNLNGKDILDVKPDGKPDGNPGSKPDKKIPDHDCFKTVRLSDILAENPVFKTGVPDDIKFETLSLRILHSLIKTEQQ